MKEQKKTKTLKRILVYLHGRSLLLFLSILFAAVTVASALLIPIFVGEAIDETLNAGNMDHALIRDRLMLVGILAAVGAIAQFLLGILNNRLSFGVVHDMRRDAFHRLQKLPLSYTDTHPVGDTVNRIINDADTFADGLLVGVTQLFSGVATILGTLILMARIQPFIALIVVVVTPLSFFVSRFIATRTHRMFMEQSRLRGESTAFINETVTNQKVVKAFSREDEVIRDFDGISERLRKVSLRATFFSSLTNPSTRFVNAVVYALVALFGALLATGAISVPIGEVLTVGTLTCFLSYANQYTKPFNEIAGVVTELQNALACAERLFAITDAETEISDADAALLDGVEGDVQFNGVSFSYTPEKPLIRDLSVDVRAGQRVAIVGPTGCGKTTLINLIMRFYDVTDGRITIDGKDLRTVTRKSLRAHYGMVLQDSWVKNGTVRENIALARPDATDEEILEAARAAHAHGFIRRLPQGYDTIVGEEGASLSEGQKQLLSIARIMLALPPVLILDEATSSIDTRTEARIQDAFKELMQGRTSFIVAHRLSTIREADLILVMKDGNIIEKGTHDSLLAENGFYATLYHSQFSIPKDEED